MYEGALSMSPVVAVRAVYSAEHLVADDARTLFAPVERQKDGWRAKAGVTAGLSVVMLKLSIYIFCRS